MAGYPTPQARDWKGPQGRAYPNKRESCSTTSELVGKKERLVSDLPTVALMVEGKEERFPAAGASGKTVSGSRSRMARGVQLNPALSRWLQGFPKEWDDCVPTGIAKVTPRVGRLRGYGNALCVPLAKEFIESYMEATQND